MFSWAYAPACVEVRRRPHSARFLSLQKVVRPLKRTYLGVHGFQATMSSRIRRSLIPVPDQADIRHPKQGVEDRLFVGMTRVVVNYIPLFRRSPCTFCMFRFGPCAWIHTVGTCRPWSRSWKILGHDSKFLDFRKITLVEKLLWFR